MAIFPIIFYGLLAYGIYQIVSGLMLLLSACAGLIVVPFGLVNDLCERASGTGRMNEMKALAKHNSETLDQAVREMNEYQERKRQRRAQAASPDLARSQRAAEAPEASGQVSPWPHRPGPL